MGGFGAGDLQSQFAKFGSESIGLALPALGRAVDGHIPVHFGKDVGGSCRRRRYIGQLGFDLRQLAAIGTVEEVESRPKTTDKKDAAPSQHRFGDGPDNHGNNDGKAAGLHHAGGQAVHHAVDFGQPLTLAAILGIKLRVSRGQAGFEHPPGSQMFQCPRPAPQLEQECPAVLGDDDELDIFGLLGGQQGPGFLPDLKAELEGGIPVLLFMNLLERAGGKPFPLHVGFKAYRKIVSSIGSGTHCPLPGFQTLADDENVFPPESLEILLIARQRHGLGDGPDFLRHLGQPLMHASQPCFHPAHPGANGLQLARDHTLLIVVHGQ